jgi:hypothetical protein
MPDSQRALFLAYSTYTGDKETFENWYDEVHIPDVLSAPGLQNAQRFVLADTKPMPGVDSPDLGHLAYYELEGDPTPFREEVKRQLMSGDMVLPDFLDQPFKTLIMEPVSEIVYADGVEPGTFPEDRHLFMAFSRYTGDEDTFNKWYDEVHVPQVLSAPGLVRAQRFVTSGVKPLPGVETPDLGHLALYEMEGDPTPFRNEVKRLLMSGEMVIPDFMIQPFTTMIMKPVSPPAQASAGAP